MPRSLAVLALALLVALTGCTATEPEPPATPSPTAVALFASDEEALAAAEETLTGYWSTVNLVRQDGGANPERLGAFSSGEWLDGDIEHFNEFSKTGKHQVGEIRFDSLALEQRFSDGVIQTVIVNICVDHSGRKTVDSSGAVVDGESASYRAPYRVILEADSENDSQLLLVKVESWQGKSC